MIRSYTELEDAVLERGFLPFFKNDLPGFSVEELTPSELWFAAGADGPWEWKGPVARGKKCAYGKLFRGKAGFVSLEWLPELANLRRDGYDFDARYDDGLAPLKDKEVFDAVYREGSLLTHALKSRCGYGRDGRKGFGPIITRLQMQTYLCVEDFEYMSDKKGRLYGWGVARYSTPEALFGAEAVTSAYSREPKESGERILGQLSRLLPGAETKQLKKLMGV